MKKCIIRILWDNGIWYTKPDSDIGFGFTLEDNSFDALVERVKIAIPDMYEECCGYSGDIELTIITERIDKLLAVRA
ncbi:MAG: DUF1902 domain-containing protein [Clostridiales bacterium]|jgi:hypothetical protein|nr:DUF1902 domain-containing protein [Clostridiales bacterium]